jgi:hypothetical protein
VYQSHREDVCARGWRRARKLMARIRPGADPLDAPDKPRGMHWATYERTLEEAAYHADAGIRQLVLSPPAWFRRATSRTSG